jgi:hypothetical protein
MLGLGMVGAIPLGGHGIIAVDGHTEWSDGAAARAEAERGVASGP